MEARRDSRPVDGPGSPSAAGTPPYPAHLDRAASLRDATAVRIRPIRPEDASMEQDFVGALSGESRYRRFFSTARELTPEAIARFTRIDYDREMALVAVQAPPGAAPSIVGVTRYVRESVGRSAEFALVVADAWQRRGLGTLLMARLEECALDAGVRLLTGVVLASNVPMLALMRARHYDLRPAPGDHTLVEVSLHFPKG